MMHVRVSYTVDATDELRRAIRQHYGREGLATRAEVQEWYRTHGSAMDQDLFGAADELAAAAAHVDDHIGGGA
jgi:hypothetical protein